MKTIAGMSRKLSKITKDLALITVVGLISFQIS